MDYYSGYKLDDLHTWDLIYSQMKLLDACIWLVDNQSSIRVASDNCLIPRSTLHRFIQTELVSLSSELHSCVEHQLKINKGNWR